MNGPSPAKLNVVTGATGLLGSHIAEQLAARGQRIRAVVRPTSDVAFLRQLGAELALCDIRDRETLIRAVAGADVVYHCAARVGDWGNWRRFQTDVIETARNVLQACQAGGVGRILYVSSVSVYGHPRPSPVRLTEDEPLGQRLGIWDHYCRAKIAAEELARAYGPEVTIIRPTWIFGPRDRNTFPRLLRALRGGWVSLLGTGDNLLNIVYAADVAEGAILAANHPNARGQVYHLCSEGEVTQRQFYDALSDALGLPRVTRQRPYWLAFWGGFVGEVIARLFRWGRAPYISRYSVRLVGRPAHFSIEKARKELGWQPRVGILEGVRRTLESMGIPLGVKT
ncbi:MAG TPA: NAD-dependent epimerase/dehydratase family protein [Gemmataceae bacterium]|nr:NAD-dependent epimerase/dehydratase family protein [Gemmataceae bacterium]